MTSGDEPDLLRALRPVPTYERAVREVSKTLSDAGIRHALVGTLGANAYPSRPRTSEDAFLVGDEAFEKHQGGFVMMLAGRTQDLADIEAIVASGADREQLTTNVQRAVPARPRRAAAAVRHVDRAR
jgi:hypothetical protein